jgi:hypothetical protein
MAPQSEKGKRRWRAVRKWEGRVATSELIAHVVESRGSWTNIIVEGRSDETGPASDGTSVRWKEGTADCSATTKLPPKSDVAGPGDMVGSGAGQGQVAAEFHLYRTGAQPGRPLVLQPYLGCPEVTYITRRVPQPGTILDLMPPEPPYEDTLDD